MNYKFIFMLVDVVVVPVVLILILFLRKEPYGNKALWARSIEEQKIRVASIEKHYKQFITMLIVWLIFTGIFYIIFNI